MSPTRTRHNRLDLADRLDHDDRAVRHCRRFPQRGVGFWHPHRQRALAGTTVTYTVATTLLPAGTAVVLVVGGFTNSPTAGTYTSTVSTKDGATTVDTGTTSSTIFTAVALTTPAWATSSTVTGAATTSYTFTFKPGTTSTLNSATMTVPQGTTGTAAKGTVTPAAVSTGGAASLTGTNLTYTFTSTGVTSGTAVSIQITGLTNTATTGSYTSTIDTFNAGVAVNSGVTAAVGFGSGVLGTPTWSASATGVSATGVSYTYTFTTATPASLSSVTMSLPTSAVKTLTVGSATGVPVGTATMTATLVTYAFTSTQVAAGTAVSLTIGGFTNTTTAGTYASTITTENGATAVDSGVSSPSLVLTTGTLTTPTWTTSSSLGASANTSYTYSFTNPTSQTLNQVTMTVPPGTSGSPVVGTVTPASVAVGGTVALAGTTITYTFTSGTVAAVAISIQLTGLTNTSISGTYPSHIYEVDALAPKASGVTPAVSIAPVPPALTVTATCGSSSTCTISAGQSQMTLIAIPGAATVTTGGFVLAVQSDSSGGYKVQTQASALTTSGGSTLLEASSSGLASAPSISSTPPAFCRVRGLRAALCAPYGSSMPFVGYSTPVAQSIWYADAPTGTGSDTVTLTDGIQASILQPAGDYTGTSTTRWSLRIPVPPHADRRSARWLTAGDPSPQRHAMAGSHRDDLLKRLEGRRTEVVRVERAVRGQGEVVRKGERVDAGDGVDGEGSGQSITLHSQDVGAVVDLDDIVCAPLDDGRITSTAPGIAQIRGHSIR